MDRPESLGNRNLQSDSNKLLFYKDIPSLKNITNLRNVSCITSAPLLNEIWLGSEYYPKFKGEEG